MTISSRLFLRMVFFAFVCIVSYATEDSCRFGFDNGFLELKKKSGSSLGQERIVAGQSDMLESFTTKHESGLYDSKIWRQVAEDDRAECAQKCLSWNKLGNEAYCVAIEFESICYWSWTKQSENYGPTGTVAFMKCNIDDAESPQKPHNIPQNYLLDKLQQTVTSTCKLYGSAGLSPTSYKKTTLDITAADHYMTTYLKLQTPKLGDTNPPFYGINDQEYFFISQVGNVVDPKDCYRINLLQSSLTNDTESSEFDDLVNGCSSTEIQATMASLQMSKAFCDYGDDDCAISRLAMGKSSFSECYGIYSLELPYVQTEEETSFVNSNELKLNLNRDAGDNCKSGTFQRYALGDCPENFDHCYDSFDQENCLYWENQDGPTTFETCGMLCDETDGCGSYSWGCHNTWSDHCQCFFVSKKAIASSSSTDFDVLDMSTFVQMDKPHSPWFSKQILEPQGEQDDIDAVNACTPVQFFEFAVSFADTYERCLNSLQTAPDGSLSDEAAECIYERLSTSDHICANVAEAISNEQAKVEQQMEDSDLAPEDNSACGWSRFLMCRGDLVDSLSHCYQKDGGLTGFSDCVLADSLKKQCEECAEIVVTTTIDDKALKGVKDWIKNFVSKVKSINKCSLRGWMQCGSDLATVYETCNKDDSRLECMMHRTKNTQCAACVGLKSRGSAQKTLTSQPVNPHRGIAQGNYVGGLLPDFSCITKLADCATKIPQAISQCGMNPACWATHALADATQCIPCVTDLLPLIPLAEPQEQKNLEGFPLPLPWPLGPLPFPLFMQDRNFNGTIDLTQSVANNPHPGLQCTTEEAAYDQIMFRTNGQWSACMQSCDTDDLCQLVHMNFAGTQKGWACSLYKSVSDCGSSAGGDDQYVFVKPGARDHVLLVGSTGIQHNDDSPAGECSTTSTNSVGAFEITVLVFLILITFLSGFSVATVWTNKRNLETTQDCQI